MHSDGDPPQDIFLYNAGGTIFVSHHICLTFSILSTTSIVDEVFIISLDFTKPEIPRLPQSLNSFPILSTSPNHAFDTPHPLPLPSPLHQRKIPLTTHLLP